MNVAKRPDWYVDQAADLLGVTRERVYQLLKRGQLVGYKNHLVWRITPQALETYMRSRAKVHGVAIGRIVAGNPNYSKWYGRRTSSTDPPDGDDV